MHFNLILSNLNHFINSQQLKYYFTLIVGTFWTWTSLQWPGAKFKISNHNTTMPKFKPHLFFHIREKVWLPTVQWLCAWDSLYHSQELIQLNIFWISMIFFCSFKLSSTSQLPDTISATSQTWILWIALELATNSILLYTATPLKKCFFMFTISFCWKLPELTAIMAES